MKTIFSLAVAWILALAIAPATWAGTIPPPVVTCPANIIAECAGASTPVEFTATAVDGNGSSLSVNCTPPGGSSFQLGPPTTVTCTTMDSLGQTDSCMFTVTVQDTIPPEVTCPADITTPPTGPGGAVVPYVAGCTDACGIDDFYCIPPSGSTFPIGMNNVTCDCFDVNTDDYCNFKVTVGTSTPPVVTCPANITAECTGGPTPVTFTATAVDEGGNSLSVTCVPPSGSGFLLGTDTVTCSAMDAGGLSDDCMFDVEVEDTTPPQVTCPDDITVQATSPSGAVVTYVAACQDPCGVDTFSCTPPSGSTFPAGMTTTTCTCSDGTGNPNSCDFKVTVTPQVVLVAIDVKPGMNTNPFNCGSKGNVPVGILSSASFNATTVDVSKVTLDPPGGTIPALLKSTTTDVNADGLLDRVVYFDSLQLGSKIGCPLPFGTNVPVTVEGQTTGGISFEGSDTLVIVRKK